MGMLDEVLKVQDRGDLLWIENVSTHRGSLSYCVFLMGDSVC